MRFAGGKRDLGIQEEYRTLLAKTRRGQPPLRSEPRLGPKPVLFRLWCPERLCQLEVVVAVKAVRAVQSSAARVRIRLGLGGWPVAGAGGVDVDHLADVRLELQQSK